MSLWLRRICFIESDFVVSSVEDSSSRLGCSGTQNDLLDSLNAISAIQKSKYYISRRLSALNLISYYRGRMRIRVLVTGGTFDKEYNELDGKLFFKDTHVHEMLKLGRCKVDVDIRTLMMVDSLEMTDEDRQIILGHCLKAKEEKILITHGTDTMQITAKVLGEAIREDRKSVV